MKLLTLLVVALAFAVPSHAVQKCTDSDGRITYADFCPTSEPAKVENLYIQDTYDPENDRLTQENVRGMEESTRQSQYDRAQRNARISRENTLPNYDTRNPSVSTKPRSSRSGGDFNDQFSDALESKLELQNRTGEVIDAGGNPSYGPGDSDRYSNENQGQGSAANSEQPMKKYWEGYDDARDNLPDFSGDPNYQDGYDEARRAQEQEQR